MLLVKQIIAKKPVARVEASLSVKLLGRLKSLVSFGVITILLRGMNLGTH